MILKISILLFKFVNVSMVNVSKKGGLICVSNIGYIILYIGGTVIKKSLYKEL